MQTKLKLKPALVAFSPTVDDVSEIDLLIRSYSVNANAARVLLPRSQESILRDIQNFILIKHNEKLVGCISLKIWNADKAEVRSLAVHPEFQGQGIGKILLQELELRAKQLRIKTLFALTVEPQFFKKSGFHIVPKLRFPEKIAGDCLSCAYQSNCNEVAVSKTVTRKLMRVV